MPVKKKTLKKTDPYTTSIQMDNFTRADIHALTLVERRKTGYSKMSDTAFLTALIARLKAEAVANGDIRQ
jgi:hypothetical protein